MILLKNTIYIFNKSLLFSYDKISPTVADLQSVPEINQWPPLPRYFMAWYRGKDKGPSYPLLPQVSFRLAIWQGKKMFG
jgi:hypothetical protein